MPPALSARAEGLNIVALTDASAATTRSAGQNSRDLLRGAGIQLMTVVPMITSMLGDFTVPAAAGLFDGMAKEGLYEAYARGNLR